jgi:hypothetical protein
MKSLTLKTISIYCGYGTTISVFLGVIIRLAVYLNDIQHSVNDVKIKLENHIELQKDDNKTVIEKLKILDELKTSQEKLETNQNNLRSVVVYYMANDSALTKQEFTFYMRQLRGRTFSFPDTFEWKINKMK